MSEVAEQQKSFTIGITGQTEFHLGNPDASIPVDISVGYRKTATGDNKTESRLFASLASIKEAGITVKDIISSATKKEEDIGKIPDILDHVAFKKFSVSYGSGGITASDLSINFDCIVTLNENTFDASILIEYKKDDKGNVVFTFKGTLKVDTYRFELQFTKQENVWYVFANINAKNIDVDLQKIAAKLFDKKTAKELPKLQFTLSNFKAFLLYTKQAETTRLLFGMGADLELNLNKLPMAGPVLSQDDAFAFKEVLAIYSKGAFSEKELTSFDAIPKVEIATGFNITTELLINGKTDCYVLNSGTSPDNEVSPNPLPAKKTDVAPLNGDVSSKAKWKKLDKKIGPVNIQRIGFAYEKGKVVLLLDASMEMIGMGMQLMGFGLGFKLEWPPKIENTDFYLDGIGLSYKAPPIEISGAFLHSVSIVDGKPVDNYSGGAIIKVSKFTISAIGAYAKVDDETSLFIYGVYDGPIGGPVFFFVTGIAAGFGYNRKVNVPSINEVASYPLVALAMQPETNGGLPQVLTSLEIPMKNGKKPIEISVGDYWLAVGIKFTSFKIIESFVLLTVNFGTQLEFAILGLSRLVWPEKSVALEPIVYVELAILAHFGPGSDVISVEAVITPNSYVLSKDCKLSGGFAFYTWVSGPYEGDFVVTLGGYHPKFVKPAHYPIVPRVALNWKIGKYVSIKGELYYALTPSAIMAGGKWEVSFKTSIIKASLVLWADMLIAWAPFQYIISVGIIVRIEATIKIAFVRIHFNFEMGAQLYIWGPPFAGKAHVDWSIFSFTIPFGDGSKKKPIPLQWHEFSKGFIPQGKPEKSKRLLKSSGDVTSNPDPINITISNGLIEVKQLGEQGTEIKFPIINPHQLAIIVDSFIPVTQLTHEGAEVDKETIMISETGNTIYDERNTAIGIRPCGFTSDEVDFIMDVKMTLKGDDISMKLVCNAKGMAEAMWGAKASENSNTNPGTVKIMTNVLTGVTLYPPEIKQVAQVRSFDFSKLIDLYDASFTWCFSQMQVASAYSSIDVLGYYNIRESKEVDGILKNTYTKTEGKRKHITSLLQTVFDDLPVIEESEINKKIIIKRTTYYRGIPIVCELGQIPQYPTDVV